MEELLKRIDELEKRVAVLEGQVQAQPRDIIKPIEIKFAENLAKEINTTIKNNGLKINL